MQTKMFPALLMRMYLSAYVVEGDVGKNAVPTPILHTRIRELINPWFNLSIVHIHTHMIDSRNLFITYAYVMIYSVQCVMKGKKCDICHVNSWHLTARDCEILPPTAESTPSVQNRTERHKSGGDKGGIQLVAGQLSYEKLRTIYNGAKDG